MTRTGIYGGSFNPIHNGHVSLARHLIGQGLVDEVWLVVSPQNPFKADASLLDEQCRLSLARLAVEHEPGIEVSDVEFALPRPSFMSSTLRTLSARYPQREFSLIIGADNWVRFPQWHEAHRLPAPRLPHRGIAPGRAPCRHSLARHQFHTHQGMHPPARLQRRGAGTAGVGADQGEGLLRSLLRPSHALTGWCVMA